MLRIRTGCLPSYQLSPSNSFAYLLHIYFTNRETRIPIRSLLQSPLDSPSLGFLDLPPELCDVVYGMILPKVIHINSAFDTEDLALLFFSRQLRQESRSIFYRTCSFYVKSKYNTLSVPLSIGTGSRGESRVSERTMYQASGI